MRNPIPAVLVVLSLLLSGCGVTLKKLNADNAFLVSAEAVNVPQLVKDCAKTDDADKRECLAVIANDSRSKCKAFLDGLVLIENTTNTAFDAFTTVFSALATVFTPLSTVHGLTAGATISSGIKNAVNSNIYAKASIANYQQTIMATYYKHMDDYSNGLPHLAGNDLVLSNEAGKILSIHAECSLAAAQATIASTIQSATGVDTGEDLYTATVLAQAASGETLTLTAVSTVFSSGLAAVSYKPAASDDEKKIADALLDKVNTDASLKAAKITASATSSPANSLVLHSPKGAHVSWQASDPKVLDVKAGGPPAASTSGEAVTPATKGAVPGKSLLDR